MEELPSNDFSYSVPSRTGSDVDIEMGFGREESNELDRVFTGRIEYTPGISAGKPCAKRILKF